MSSRHSDIITRPVRRVLEDEIERLIAMLDEIDGDADFEPDVDDEDTHDREEVCEDEGANSGDDEPDSDDEPSLGWTSSEAAYCRHTSTLDPDMEEQCEDEGADRDDAEPVLGWPENDGNPAAYTQTSAHDDEVLSW